MRHILIYILSVVMIACSSQLYAQDIMRHEKKQRVSIGIKGGFNSTMTFTDEISYGDQDITDIQNNYKVGYIATLFTRINLIKKHFIQPEISYAVSHGSISMSNLRENATILEDNALIKTKISSLEVPILYGYKFIDSYPYGMSFFLGPKIAWTIKKQSYSEYSGFYQKNIVEHIKPINYSAVLGIGVNISNIFFDFRYEIGCNNITKSVSYDHASTPEPYNEKEITLKRRKNILSFSVGAIF
ncbi:porin family protein [Bacteroides caecigallinarum]|uniref:porin family protein n=1 Tax=uncultured Bacteroides sp. TaxID=162156 RepID=UPI0025981FD2|nr:porin family protein [uncultured Bacteroides sp.]MDN0052524.1 porin family protein [Bacteroides caecigallinarum]MDN0071989.1 porin family protein [Bacteroides caecigallinarum]